jgi:hypothetical protein
MEITFQDLSSTFSLGDIAASLALSFVLSAIIGWVYRATHRNVSYSQSYVQTLIIRWSARCRWSASATRSRRPATSGSSSW